MLAEAGGSQIPHDRLLTSENPVRATTPKHGTNPLAREGGVEAGAFFGGGGEWMSGKG
jgi:hypothetical protein